MVEFKVRELSERNYKEGDTVYVKFKIRTTKSSADEEAWLQSEENEKSLWLTQDHVVYGEPYQYRDGDLINYNGVTSKVIRGFDDQWYVLNMHGQMLVLDPTRINSIIKEENVL
jgi:hypothetical protein